MNLDRFEAILRLLHRQGHVEELTVEGEGWRLQARKSASAPLLLPEVEITEEGQPEPERHGIPAPVVGFFRALDTPPRPGDHVAEGSVVGHIDSMRILNPVTAGESGYVVSTSVEDGEPVEFGQELFALTPELPSQEA
jgi:biotin carboxyl carrier protein